MNRELRFVLSVVLVCGLLGRGVAAPVTQGANADVLKQAQSDLAGGNGQAAYDALLPLVDELAGTPTFDNLFGQAALATHHDTRAAMAFDRCLAVEPNNGDCRLGMARAHMNLDEKQSAHDELVTIQRSSPPPAVAKVVQQYLGELSGAASTTTRQLHVWVELGGGFDNNTNVAPSTSTITLPGSSGLSGTFQSATDSSTFDQGSLGASLMTPISDHWDFLAGANVQATGNFQVASDSYFDTVAQAGGYLGASVHYGKQRFGLVARGQNYALSGDSYRNLGGVLGQYGYSVSEVTQASLFIQRSRFDYQYGAGADLQNVNSTSGGFSLTHSLMQNQLIVTGGAYTGSDRKVEDAADSNISSDYVGLRAGGTWFWSKETQTGINVLAENRNYEGKGDGFLFTDRSRKDHLVTTDLSWVRQVAAGMSLRVQYSYTNNDSNVAIRDYDRQIFSVGVHYDFL
jgi:hypothetical protein